MFSVREKGSGVWGDIFTLYFQLNCVHLGVFIGKVPGTKVLKSREFPIEKLKFHIRVVEQTMFITD